MSTKNAEEYLTIIIPTYNEQQRIEQSLKSIYEYLSKQEYSYKLVISDDGSSDDTVSIVKKYMKDWDELNLIENTHKGKAPAIISGINKAEGKYVLFTDIDLSVPIEELSKFLIWLENEDYDVAIATREGPGSERVNEPFTRHLMGRVFNVIVQFLILPGINDTQCGFKLFKSDVAKDIFNRTILYSADSEEITGAKVSGFDVELLYIARSLGYKIKEVPVRWIYGDSSKVHSFKDSYYNLMDVIKVRRNSIKGLYRNNHQDS